MQVLGQIHPQQFDRLVGRCVPHANHMVFSCWDQFLCMALAQLIIRSILRESANAVKTQVWIAVCVYVLVAIIRKELGLSESLHKILQVLSVNAFEKVPLDQGTHCAGSAGGHEGCKVGTPHRHSWSRPAARP
jgi:hypothetical protein